MKKLIAGNWKMNNPGPSLSRELAELLTPQDLSRTDVLLCPPSAFIAENVSTNAEAEIHVGAQNCHAEVNGAHTGDVSAEMLATIGASHVIVGHSERRSAYAETNEIVRAKAEAVHRAGLVPIVCVGENLAVRKAGQAVDAVTAQADASLPLDRTKPFAVAYEPIWAIGTGEAASASDIEEMHAVLRTLVDDTTPILYGGSVKASNAAEILSIANVDGALVGGASLTASDFYGIISAPWS